MASSQCILRNATVRPQPGDGHCLFHALAAGMGGQLSGPALRMELAFWLRGHAMETVSDNTFQEWIDLDSQLSVEAYCSQMCEQHTWGGGIELTAFARYKQTHVHVFPSAERNSNAYPFSQVPRLQGKKSICCILVGVITISLWMVAWTTRKQKEKKEKRAGRARKRLRCLSARKFRRKELCRPRWESKLLEGRSRPLLLCLSARKCRRKEPRSG